MHTLHKTLDITACRNGLNHIRLDKDPDSHAQDPKWWQAKKRDNTLRESFFFFPCVATQKDGPPRGLSVIPLRDTEDSVPRSSLYSDMQKAAEGLDMEPPREAFQMT